MNIRNDRRMLIILAYALTICTIIDLWVDGVKATFDNVSLFIMWFVLAMYLSVTKTSKRWFSFY